MRSSALLLAVLATPHAASAFIWHPSPILSGGERSFPTLAKLPVSRAPVQILQLQPHAAPSQNHRRNEGRVGLSSTGIGKLSMASDGDGDENFWAQQKALAASIRDDAAKSVREEQMEKFAKRRLALVTECLFFSALIFSFLWLICSSPFPPISYVFGATLGTAYSYGLGKFVETLGGSADDAGEVQGAGVGQARFAFLVLLFVFVGKFRGQGLQEIPAIAGFFTYQLASLSVGLREIYDE
mmetsp:Transcript_29629/g.60498  ORF Transcript_29629/g.60498 Transcript_29629/m.60498 type:complete len:241 (-) Transcript_29629:169-891(-)